MSYSLAGSCHFRRSLGFSFLHAPSRLGNKMPASQLSQRTSQLTQRCGRLVPVCMWLFSTTLGSHPPVEKNGCGIGGAFGTAKPELGSTPFTPEGAVKLYDEWAPTYDATYSSWGVETAEKAAELLEKMRMKATKSQNNYTVLDSGCGTGVNGEVLRSKGVVDWLSGVDISPASLDWIRRRKTGVYNNLVVANLEDVATKPLPFAADTFDAIVCTGVLAYVQNYADVFTEWVRLSHPGGVVIFTHFRWYAGDGSKSAAESLQASGKWHLLYESDDSPYMPNNPDPSERAKRIKYFVFQVNK